MLRFLKVTGKSLEPLYQAGDFVLIARIPFALFPLHPQDVVVVRHPEYGTLIKIVQDVDAANGRVTLMGLDQDSIDSRLFGSLPLEQVAGKVVWHIRSGRGERGG